MSRKNGWFSDLFRKHKQKHKAGHSLIYCNLLLPPRLGICRRLVVRRGLQLLFAFQLHALSAAQHIFRRSDALDEEPLARLASFVRSPSRSDAQADACQTAFSNFHAFLKNYSKPAEVSKADGEAEGLVMNRLVATLHRHLRACAAAAKRNDSGQTTTPSPILEWDELQVEAIGVELEAAMRNEKPSPGTPAESDDPSAHSKESTVSPKSGQTNSGATNNNHSNSNSNSSNNNNESFEKFLSAVTQVSESGDDGGFAAMSASATNGAEEEDGGCVSTIYLAAIIFSPARTELLAPVSGLNIQLVRVSMWPCPCCCCSLA